jgi:hypothetical protein
MLLLAAAGVHAANITVSPWQPVFKGIELASGRQEATVAGEFNHRVLCYRVDLGDPDVVLFTTPKCTNCGVFDTLAQNTSHFLEQYGVQVAINGGFYSSSTGPNDVPLGTPEDVRGLAISLGNVVSPADEPTRAATLLFTTNNQPIFIPNNNPGTNTDGIFTALSGDRPLLTNGVVAPAPNPNDRDPRTAFGLSQDRRYLYLMTLDGRQPGWSDGADWYNTALWLQRFGAYDGINVDGGGSTTLTMADCQGKSIRLNRSSYVFTYGRERIIGHNFGVYAKPLPTPLRDLTVMPGTTTAIITWKTDLEATTQVEFGSDTNYTGSTVPDPRLTRNHIATLTGLAPGSNYFFRALSVAGAETLSAACRFSTTNAVNRTRVFDLNNVWSYTTNNLDGVNWKARSYDDSGWIGSGPGLLYTENNALVAPRNTLLPPGIVTSGTPIPRTYYFRTHFMFTGPIAGLVLTFSNYIDDGAVFHLNGAEIFRLRMPAAPAPVVNSTAASGTPCAGTAQAGDAATTCPDVFSVSGSILTNLVQGDNVLAVETHNAGATSTTDLVFGSALILSRPASVVPQLGIALDGDLATLYWNGEGFALQQTTDLSSTNSWTNVNGPVAMSPTMVTNSATALYRLRQ